MSAGNSKRAIVAAFLANLGIAVSKFIAYAFTGSASMLSEAIHSVADTANQGLLLFGRKRSQRLPDEQHPFGYGSVRYFWAFVVALVLFSAGGLFSIFEAFEKLRHPHEVEGLGWAIGVLLAAMVMESFSLRTAVKEANHARGKDESWWRFIRHTKNPEFPVVLLEDLAALFGLAFALIGVVLAKVTDEPRWDAAGSLAIGVLLVLVAAILAWEMSSLLLGEAARPEDVAAIERAIDQFPAVKRCIHLRTEHIGPDTVLVAAKLEFEPTLSMEALAGAIDDLEVQIRAAVPTAQLIFIEPDVYRPEADPAVTDAS